MNEVDETQENMETAVSDDAPLNFAMFNKMSPGVQRLVIAVLFVLALVLAVVIRELMKSEEAAVQVESAE